MEYEVSQNLTIRAYPEPSITRLTHYFYEILCLPSYWISRTSYLKDLGPETGYHEFFVVYRSPFAQIQGYVYFVLGHDHIHINSNFFNHPVIGFFK